MGREGVRGMRGGREYGGSEGGWRRGSEGVMGWEGVSEGWG